MTNTSDTSSAKSAPDKEFVATLPFRSQQIDDPAGNFDISVWRCSENVCEFGESAHCDTGLGVFGRGKYQSWVVGHEELLRYQRDGLLPLQDGFSS